jgi:hypothetical protein
MQEVALGHVGSALNYISACIIIVNYKLEYMYMYMYSNYYEVTGISPLHRLTFSCNIHVKVLKPVTSDYTQIGGYWSSSFLCFYRLSQR